MTTAPTTTVPYTVAVSRSLDYEAPPDFAPAPEVPEYGAAYLVDLFGKTQWVRVWFLSEMTPAGKLARVWVILEDTQVSVEWETVQAGRYSAAKSDDEMPTWAGGPVGLDGLRRTTEREWRTIRKKARK